MDVKPIYGTEFDKKYKVSTADILVNECREVRILLDTLNTCLLRRSQKCEKMENEFCCIKFLEQMGISQAEEQQIEPFMDARRVKRVLKLRELKHKTWDKIMTCNCNKLAKTREKGKKMDTACERVIGSKITNVRGNYTEKIGQNELEGVIKSWKMDGTVISRGDIGRGGSHPVRSEKENGLRKIDQKRINMPQAKHGTAKLNQQNTSCEDYFVVKCGKVDDKETEYKSYDVKYDVDSQKKRIKTKLKLKEESDCENSNINGLLVKREPEEEKFYTKIQRVLWLCKKKSYFKLISEYTTFLETQIPYTGRLILPQEGRQNRHKQMGENDSKMDTDTAEEKSWISIPLSGSIAGTSQSTDTATAVSEKNFKDTMDKLLTDLQMVNIQVSEGTGKCVAPTSFPTLRDMIDELGLHVKEEDRTEENISLKIKKVQEIMNDIVIWLGKFREGQNVFMKTMGSGSDRTSKILDNLIKLSQDSIVVGEANWELTVSILTQMTVVLKDMLDNQNTITRNIAEWMNLVTVHLGLENEQDKLMQTPLIASAEGQMDENLGYEQRLDYGQLSPEQKQLFNMTAVSVGRDGIQEDPLCLSKMITPFVLPGLKEEQTRHLESEDFRQRVMKDFTCFSIDQAILLRKAAIFEHINGYDTVTRLEPEVDSATWLGKGGLNIGRYTDEKDAIFQPEVKSIVKKQISKLFLQDEDTRHLVCAAVLHVLGALPAVGDPIEYSEDDLENELCVYYCSRKDDLYSTGWLKSDANHKLAVLWRGENYLGTHIKECIKSSWVMFRKWYDLMLSIDERQAINEIFIRARKLAQLWEQDSSTFDDTKIRVQTMEWNRCGHLPDEVRRRLNRERRYEVKSEDRNKKSSVSGPSIGGTPAERNLYSTGASGGSYTGSYTESPESWHPENKRPRQTSRDRRGRSQSRSRIGETRDIRYHPPIPQQNPQQYQQRQQPYYRESGRRPEGYSAPPPHST